jgi:hypothetical protein
LNEITKQLNAFEEQKSIRPSVRYRELQADWDIAFREFEAATKEFSAVVIRLPGKIGPPSTSE